VKLKDAWPDVAGCQHPDHYHKNIADVFFLMRHARARVQSARHAFVQPCEQFRHLVRDEQQLEIPNAPQIIQYVCVFELVHLVKNHDIGWAVVVAKAVHQHVGRRGPALNVERLASASNM